MMGIDEAWKDFNFITAFVILFFASLSGYILNVISERKQMKNFNEIKALINKTEIVEEKNNLMLEMLVNKEIQKK